MLVKLSIDGAICLSNYIYEVEGEDVESGLTQLTELIEAKIPILRTVIVQAGDGKTHLNLLLSKGISPWIRASSLGAYLGSTFTQKLELGGSPLQYAIIHGDNVHEDKTLFVISIHHCFFDAFSRFLMEKDMSQILQSSTQYAQEPERPWYGDFAKRMRSLPDYDGRVHQYWSSYLDGVDFSNIHPQSQASPSGIQDGVMPWTRLAFHNTNSASGQQTPIILAAWSLALARQSGLRDIIFGLARHGRSDSHQDVRRMVGPLLSFTPLRMGFSEGAAAAAKDRETASELIQRIQDEVSATARWEQGAIPGVYPDANGSPWVQSLVNLKSELFAMPNGYIDKEGRGQISKFLMRRDLQHYDMKSHWAVILSVNQKQDNVEACMGYRSSLIGHEKAQSLFGDFIHLVKELALRRSPEQYGNG